METAAQTLLPAATARPPVLCLLRHLHSCHSSQARQACLRSQGQNVRLRKVWRFRTKRTQPFTFFPPTTIRHTHTHTHTHTLETLALLSETHEKQLVCTSKETKQGKRGDGALRMIDLSTSSCCRGEGEGGGGGGERKGCKCQASATPITE